MFDDSKKRPQKNCANDSLSNNLLENSKNKIYGEIYKGKTSKKK